MGDEEMLRELRGDEGTMRWLRGPGEWERAEGI